MMVPAMLEQLVEKYTVTIGSNILADAEALASKHHEHATGLLLDVGNHEEVLNLIKQHDLVISYVPPFLHMKVAKPCLEAGKHMVTASYISPEMRALDTEVKKKGLIFFNEIGLDPGIDIMSSMKIKDEVEAQGGKIIGYESWCGGLPDAVCAGDNPLHYKFSWAPQAVFNTSKNSATFLVEGEEVTIEGKDLLSSGTSHKNFHPAYKIEGYPNRDSISFRNSFDFKDAKTFIRGTLRYEGFGMIM